MAMTMERMKELAAPIADGLFGKQRTSRFERPHYTVRPVRMIVEDLCRIPEEDWYKYAFSREPLNGKFTDEQRKELSDKAIACGREYAEKLAAEYGNRDPEFLAKKMGAELDFPLMPQSPERVLFAEFREPNKIHIYMDGVSKGKALLPEPGVSHILTGQLDISKLLIGHELFHMVEEKYKNEIWTRTYRFKLWNIGSFEYKTGLHILGEIAAMSFTKTLNRLPYSPYVMDAFLVYGYDPEVACGLYEEMMERVGLTPRLPEDDTGVPKKLPKKLKEKPEEESAVQEAETEPKPEDEAE